MMEGIRIEKKEIKYAVAGAIVILAWFLLIRPALAPLLESIHPTIATIIFSMGLLAGLWLLSSFLNGHSFHIKFSIITFIVLLGINILTPPYLVSENGTIHTEVEYWYVSADAGFASFWEPIVPTNWLWYFAYIVNPILLMIIIPIIIADPKTIKGAIR